VALALCASAQALVPNQALAQDDSAEVVTDLSNQGIAKYKAGDYEEAIKLFKQAYELEQVPNLLYNIARCYEKLEQYNEAIKYYEKFVVAPEVESEARQTALSRAENLREVLKARGELADNNNGNGGNGGGSGNGGNGGNGNGNGNGDSGQKSVKSMGPAFAVLGVGVAGLAVGGTFGFLAMQQETAFEEATTPEDKRAAQTKGVRNSWIADGSMIGGAIFTTVGLIMVVKRSKSDTASSDARSLSEEEPAPKRASLAPWFGRDGGGLQMELRF
jgi:hypothetical protein